MNALPNRFVVAIVLAVIVIVVAGGFLLTRDTGAPAPTPPAETRPVDTRIPDMLSTVPQTPVAAEARATHERSFQGSDTVALLQALSDPDPAARLAAVSILGTKAKDDAAALEGVASALADEHPDVQAAAAAALVSLGEPAAMSVAKVASSDDEATAQRACNVLRRIGAPAIDAIASLTTSPSEGTRARAVTTLGELGEEASAARSILLQSLTDSISQVRIAAVGAVNTVLLPDDDEAIAWLTERLDDKEWLVRLAAANALASHGAAVVASAPALAAHARTESNAGVRSAELRAIAAIGPAAKEVAPILREMANSSDRALAADALAALLVVDK